MSDRIDPTDDDIGKDIEVRDFDWDRWVVRKYLGRHKHWFMTEYPGRFKQIGFWVYARRIDKRKTE